MLKCNTLIIQGKSNTEGIKIGNSELIVEDGNFKLKDISGNVNDISKSKLDYVSINIDNIIQTINNTNVVYDIIIDEYLNTLNDTDIISKGDKLNSIKIKNSGFYLISYNINLELLNNSKTTSKAFLRLLNNDKFEIIKKTTSYGYHHQKLNGHDSLDNTYLSYFNVNDEIKLSVQIHDGKGFLKTIPDEININILKIE